MKQGRFSRLVVEPWSTGTQLHPLLHTPNSINEKIFILLDRDFPVEEESLKYSR